MSQGTLRARRTGPRRLFLEQGEQEYLREHWHLLAGLREALRTQREVRLAVLYGSLSRGDEDPESDLDLLVSLKRKDSTTALDRAVSLGEVAGRPVDIALLSRIEDGAPLLLDRILDEGRVLVDRDGEWPDLLERRRAIRSRARRAHHRQMGTAGRAIAELIG